MKKAFIITLILLLVVSGTFVYYVFNNKPTDNGKNILITNPNQTPNHSKGRTGYYT